MFGDLYCFLVVRIAIYDQVQAGTSDPCVCLGLFAHSKWNGSDSECGDPNMARSTSLSTWRGLQKIWWPCRL